MSNLSPASPIGPLSVGNVVSAGVRIYRSHLKQYFKLSLRAALWNFIPVYGWAKSAEIAGAISRLAYSELVDKPETVTDARRHTSPRLWQFFVTRLLIGLIAVGSYIGLVIGGAIIISIGVIAASTSPPLVPLSVILGIVVVITVIIILLRLGSRLFVYDLPMAIEDNIDSTTSISRCWSLTKGSVGRIQWILFVAFLITLLVYLPAIMLYGVIVSPTTRNEMPELLGLLRAVNFAVGIVLSALITPYWQVIKAVVYYDLRARREGLGLQLRDR
ncbi:MAG: DUF975 domain-containing protein [Phormidesmis sp. CAN_BIN36]|nr:DUF975 domain-containing protein [Phormidesmis sp. CAN_BIN36]